VKNTYNDSSQAIHIIGRICHTHLNIVNESSSILSVSDIRARNVFQGNLQPIYVYNGSIPWNVGLTLYDFSGTTGGRGGVGGGEQDIQNF
jgi:hypothetical protein